MPLRLLLLLSLAAPPVLADEPPPPSDASPLPDAGPADAAPPSPPPSPLRSVPVPVDVPVPVPGTFSASPERPFYSRPLFWASTIIGAATLGVLIYGAAWTATYTPRYALVTF